MCGHSDPFITYLKSIGYSAIRLPRADIRPLQLLAKSGKELDWLGDLAQLFQSGSQLPTLRQNEVATDVSGQQSGELSLGVGLSLLGNLIGAMGGSKLGANAAYRGASSITFRFSDVLRDSVETIELDKYLGSSDVDPAAVTVGKMLDADVIYVTTATIKSHKYTVESKQSSGTDFDIDVPVVQQAVVGANFKVSGTGQRSATISFEGATPLVFGFQAVQLFYSQGRYTLLRPVGAGSVVAKALSNVPNDGIERFVTDNTFATVH